MTDVSPDATALRRLTDLSSIHRLVDRYAYAVDDRDWAAWAACFTTDATVTFPFGTFHGNDGLEQWGRDALAAFESSHHVLTNIKVDFASEHEAALRAKIIATHVPKRDDPSVFFAEGGDHTWHLIKIDGRWLIRSLHLGIVWTLGNDEEGLSGGH
ncbi:hypothetical protein SUDANB60_06261 (plasmid) [Streptomyces sp. enrichment culture]|uniref:nuclear transport factor 2 family protein n=1 Tax=Streptomyces sp. enrichment culture TaxID=1795815 RepID=UPI003F571A05